ncbi:MAG TPA: pitrilysin family protein, partial [Thermomicrobiaceae bacterium]|nr:pitrilysin family protein [Thermomicrobiaceae bacterium]
MPTTPPTLTTRLDNGLTVILRESHRAPVASFWVWYRVGARNEVPGITGISHWTEHMLFKGTPTFPPGTIFRTVNKHGGSLNGFTWIDYTAYFETLPASHILLGADIEADRMQHAVFDPAEVHGERTVILSEREGNENQPTFYLREEVNAAAFKAHPYGQGVIGFTSDLHQITRDDLYRHYRTYYVPNNATVVAVGDFDSHAMLAEIERRFGGIAQGDDPPPVRTQEPAQQGPRRITVRRPAPTATMLAVFHAPDAANPDTPALLVLDTVLSGGKS